MSSSPVEHVQVEAGEHAFAWASSREGAASSHHHVEHRKRNKVILLKWQKCYSVRLCYLKISLKHGFEVLPGRSSSLGQS